MTFDWVCFVSMVLAAIAGVGVGVAWTAIKAEARRTLEVEALADAIFCANVEVRRVATRRWLDSDDAAAAILAALDANEEASDE